MGRLTRWVYRVVGFREVEVKGKKEIEHVPFPQPVSSDKRMTRKARCMAAKYALTELGQHGFVGMNFLLEKQKPKPRRVPVDSLNLNTRAGRRAYRTRF